MTTYRPRLGQTARNLARLAALSITAALLVVPTAAFAAEGNNGTLKVHEQGTPSGTESNDPKVCIFNFEGFGFDVGQDGFIVIDGQGQTTGSFGPFDFGPTVANVDHLSYAETVYFNDADGPEITNGLFVATLYGKDTGGNINLEDEKAKSKVFMVECEPGGEEPSEETPEGNVLVTKLVDADGDLATTGDQTPAANWAFDFGITGGEIVDETTTTGADGTAGFTYTTEGDTAAVTVTEDLPADWALLAAGCRIVVDDVPGDAVGTWSGLGVSFDAATGGNYACVFVNAELADEEPTDEEPTDEEPTDEEPTDEEPAAPRPTAAVTLPPTDSLGSAGTADAGSLLVVLAGLVLATVTVAVVTVRRGARLS